MAMGRVQVGFFDAQTRPAGPPLLPRPGPFNKWFFLAPNPPRQVFTGPVQPLLGLIRDPIRPNLIKKKKPK